MALRNYKIGGAVTDTPTDGKCLWKRVATTKYETLATFAGAYQVPVGKTLYVTHILLNGDTANWSIEFGYGDDAVNGSATPPTNSVKQCEDLGSAAAFNTLDLSVFFPVPAGKYPYVFGNGAGNVACTIQGFEI